LPRHVIYYIMEFMVSFNTKYIICFKCFFDSIMIGLFLSLDILMMKKELQELVV
jgi:hypothetical protein